MIEPFQEHRLAPASYALTLGPRFKFNDRNGLLTEEEPELRLPPNSIVFISFCEVIRLPHYIAARFDLTVSYLYEGLLLASGPQIDPGWQGALSTTLHNISNNDVTVQLGQPIAKIEFLKTTALASGARDVLDSINDEETLYARRESLVGHGGQPLVFFKRSRRWASPILDYASGRKMISSSVAEIAKTSEEALALVSRVRRRGVAGLIGLALSFIALLFAVVGTNYFYVNARFDQARETAARQARAAARRDIRDEEMEIKRLRSRVRDLERGSARRRPRGG